MTESKPVELAKDLKDRFIPLAYDLVNSSVRRDLRRRNAEKLARFASVSTKFKGVLAEVSNIDPTRYLTTEWVAFLEKIHDELGETPGANFLRLPSLKATVASVPYPGRLLSGVIKSIENHELDNPSRAALREDSVGDPVIVSRKYQTSFPRLQHLSHIVSHFEGTGAWIGREDVVMEWGGGYGDLAKMCYQLSREKGTYVIVDVPLMITLQWLYLATVLGSSCVNVVGDGDPGAIREGKINLFPVSDAVTRITFESFVSTWAISESSLEAERLIWRNPSLHKCRLLVSYSISDPLSEMLRAEGARVAPIHYHKRQFYLFR
jgi:hypothetical protein